MQSSSSAAFSNHQNQDNSLLVEETNSPAPATPTSIFPPALLPFVPEVNPRPWNFINIFFVLYGCASIAEVWYARNHNITEERPFAVALYLIFEFSVCFFWVAEAALSSGYQYFYLMNTELKWYTKLELVIAVYFFFSTTVGLFQWDLGQYSMDKILDLALDTVFYLYIVLRNYQMPSADSTMENPPNSTTNGALEGGNHEYQNIE